MSNANALSFYRSQYAVCPNILCQTKNRTVFSATPKSFVLALKLNLLNANHLLVWDKKF